MKLRTHADRQRNVDDLKNKLASGRSPRWAFMERFVVPDYSNPESDDDYLDRIRLIQTPWWGIYLHKLGTPDPRPTLHDHPWPFVAIMLRGGYTQQRRDSHEVHLPRNGGDLAKYSYRQIINRINVMPLDALHYIERLHRTPTWTLVFVGRRQRVWGYLDRDGTFTDFLTHPFNAEFLAAMERRAQR